MTENNATLESILKTVHRIEDAQASMDSDMSKDRQDLQNLTIRLQAVEAELSQLRKAVNTSSDRTRDKVAEAVTPVIDMGDRLATQIHKAKKLYIPEPRNWFDRLMNKLVRG